MKNPWKSLKARYLEGIELMKEEVGIPSMMYLATTILILLIYCLLAPETATQYVTTGAVNVILVYLYSWLVSHFIFPGTSWLLKPLGSIIIQFLVGYVLGRSLSFWLLLVLFVVPIIAAIIMIFVTESFINYEYFIHIKGLGIFSFVIFYTLIPILAIVGPLFFLEWSIWVKLAIVFGFILISPLMCWAEEYEYGIFGALGIEW